MLPEFHFAKYAFALKLLFQHSKRLIDIIVTYLYLHAPPCPFYIKRCPPSRQTML